MRVLVLTIFCLAVALGCRPKDPIERVVQEESANGHFPSGMYRPIDLPATASPEQVIGKVFGAPLKVVTNREVRISDDLYTAVVVESGGGRKVVLIRYERGPKLSGWWSRVYDD